MDLEQISQKSSKTSKKAQITAVFCSKTSILGSESAKMHGKSGSFLPSCHANYTYSHQKGGLSSGGGGSGSSPLRRLPRISPPSGPGILSNEESSGLANRVNSPRNLSSTSPVAPLRCLAMMICAMPRRSFPFSS